MSPAPPGATGQLRPLTEADVEYGCGCSFSEPIGEEGIGRFLILWLYEEKAKLRLGDTLHLLDLVDVESVAHKELPQLGDKQSFHLIGDGLEVRIDCTTSRVCELDSESCEATWFDGFMQIRSGSESETIPVRGACGC